ncbi:putative G-protein coupled receptor [Brachyhypopomus gauderio]|uniref:putative G-protein coupled receptor n=1 Tax=Brachyhypopomus gauderio TaxID=698409 RepID=UPI004042E17D
MPKMDVSGLTQGQALNETDLNTTFKHVPFVHLSPSMQLGTMSNPQSRLRDLTGLVAMVTLNIVALVANVAILAVVGRARHLRRYGFVGHLCAVDVLCAALLMPLAIVCGSPLFAGVIFSALECRLYVFLNTFLISASIFSVTAISVERYYYIVHPMRYEAKMTPRLAAGVMVTVWVASALLGLATVFGWPNHGRQSSIAAAHCSLHWSHSGHRRIFAIVFCVLCFCVPAAIILAVYANVYKVAHTAARHRGPLPSWVVVAATPRPKRRSDSVNSQTTIITTSSSVRRETRAPRTRRRPLVGGKAALTLAVIVGQFVLCWLPYFAFHLHLSLGFSHSAAVAEAEGPVTWLAYSSFAMNPFFYGLLNRQIREELRKAVFCCCRGPTGRPAVRTTAPGRERSSRKDFLHFLNRSSSAEATRSSCHTATPRTTLDQTAFRIPGQIPEEVS